ncbi:hypothetical protein PQX77_004914 [Marasmius sp. AFHP31]|nr:hypothetical protein PQX77_004914 [Marasmius sp. AFHP31]
MSTTLAYSPASLPSSEIQAEGEQVKNDPKWVREMKDREFVRKSNKKRVLEIQLLTLDYMLNNCPFHDDNMPGVYLPVKLLNHYPPVFEYGVSLSWDQLVEFAEKKGILEDYIKKYSASGAGGREDCDLSMLPIYIELYLNKICGTRRAVQHGIPFTGGLKFSFNLWTTYDIRVPESRQFEVIEIMKKEFGVDKLEWHMAYTNEEELKADYTVSEDLYVIMRKGLGRYDKD